MKLDVKIDEGFEADRESASWLKLIHLECRGTIKFEFDEKSWSIEERIFKVLGDLFVGTVDLKAGFRTTTPCRLEEYGEHYQLEKSSGENVEFCVYLDKEKLGSHVVDLGDLHVALRTEILGILDLFRNMYPHLSSEPFSLRLFDAVLSHGSPRNGSEETRVMKRKISNE